MRYVVDSVKVAPLPFLGDKENAGKGCNVTVHPHVVRVNDAVTVHTEGVVVKVRGYDERSGVLPYAALSFLELANAGSVIGHFLASPFHLNLLGGKEIAGDFHFHGLGGAVTEGYGTVGVNHGRFHAGAAEQCLLAKCRYA